MVSKAKKARRRENQQRKQAQRNQTEVVEEHKVITAPEGTSCVHFMDVDPSAIQSTLRLIPGPLYCKECNINAQPARRGKGQKKKAARNAGTSVRIQTPNSKLWICLQCGNLGCNRELRSHGASHFDKTKHTLSLQVETKAVWCYPCDSYISMAQDCTEYQLLRETVQGFTQELVYRQKSKESKKTKIQTSQTNKNPLYSTKNFAAAIEAVRLNPGTGLRGLHNLGNTCFFNSIMQNVVQFTLLREHLFSMDKMPTEEGILTARLREFMVQMWKGEGEFNPQSLHSTIVKANPRFRGFRQQDSHELLQCLLDGVRMEEIDRLRATGTVDSKTCPETFIDTIFGGQLVSCITCHTCKAISTVTESFHDLLLPIPLSQSATSTPSYQKLQSDKQKRKQQQEAIRKRKLASKLSNEKTESKEITNNHPKLDTESKIKENDQATSLEEKKHAIDNVTPVEEVEEQQTTSTMELMSSLEQALMEIILPAEEVPGEQEIEKKVETGKIILKKEKGEKGENERNQVLVVDGDIFNGKENENGKEELLGEKAAVVIKPMDYRAPMESVVGGSCSIMTCLQQFTNPEILSEENAYKCLACTRKKYRAVLEKLCETTGDYSALLVEEDIPESSLKSWVTRTATKQFMIKIAPPLLTIGLKRFGRGIGMRSMLRKLDNPVAYPYQLDILPFVYQNQDSNDGEAPQCTKYFLSGFSSHGGGMSGGHYVAYIRSSSGTKVPGDEWYYFSDSTKRKVTLEHVRNQQAYVLFYKRADTIQ